MPELKDDSQDSSNDRQLINDRPYDDMDIQHKRRFEDPKRSFEDEPHRRRNFDDDPRKFEEEQRRRQIEDDKRDMLLCEICNTYLPSIDELQVHLLTEHYDNEAAQKLLGIFQ